MVVFREDEDSYYLSHTDGSGKWVSWSKQDYTKLEALHQADARVGAYTRDHKPIEYKLEVKRGEK